ncbi:hypothetical protein BC831DRAFT_456779 [Entophlyctis helioformis]|nr:hypothetical protein BC831DRAFT_456779 [Entophlyctis helioformis]
MGVPSCVWVAGMAGMAGMDAVLAGRPLGTDRAVCRSVCRCEGRGGPSRCAGLQSGKSQSGCSDWL